MNAVLVVDEKKAKVRSIGGLEGRLTLSPKADAGPPPETVAYAILHESVDVMPGHFEFRVSATSAKARRRAAASISTSTCRTFALGADRPRRRGPRRMLMARASRSRRRPCGARHQPLPFARGRGSGLHVIGHAARLCGRSPSPQRVSALARSRRSTDVRHGACSFVEHPALAPEKATLRVTWTSSGRCPGKPVPAPSHTVMTTWRSDPRRRYRDAERPRFGSVPGASHAQPR